MASANIAQLDVESIVGEVLARLRSDLATAGENPRQSTTVSGRLVVDESLVTLAGLHGRLAGIKQLAVRPKAVLTPAVKDLLRERRVEVVFENARGAASDLAQANEKPRVMLGLAETSYDPAALARNLRQEGVELEQISKTGLQPTLEELTDGVVQRGWRGWLLTGEAPAAVCLANRKSAVRAAGAGSVKDVKTALRSAGANLLIVDPAGKSYWELLQIGRAFARGGECPDWLKSLL